MFKQDPDVVRWGLDSLCDYHPTHNSVCSRTTTQCENFRYDENHVREDNVSPDHCTVENDEAIAHALQEELSQLAVAEASGSSSTTDEQSRASVLVQDLLVSSGKGYNHGDGDHHEEGDNMEPSTSGSSPEEYYEGNEWPSELTNDYFDLDGEVGKKLSKMVPIPHVPKINGVIPSVDEATSDHQRLLERLRLYDLLEVMVQGDGNCQFRALSDQLYRTTHHHRFVRQQIVNQLKSHHDIYEGYVPMAYADYLKKLSKDGEWGDHVTLQAAADLYGVKIFVITSFKDTCSIEILPTVEKSKRVILLSFWAEVHYNSIYPEGELPISNIKKKKRDFFLDQLPSSCTVM